MNKFITSTLILAVAGSVAAMPVESNFFVGKGTAHVALEGTRATMSFGSPDAGGSDQRATMQHAMVKARYGLLSNAECAVEAGAANLVFRNLPYGYNDFDSRFSPAWGAGLRYGVPLHGGKTQIIANLNYFGAWPSAEITNGSKAIRTKYLWNEISPALTAGRAFGSLAPYVGLTKTYLFGSKDVEVKMNGINFPTAAGTSHYSDGRQPVRGLVGFRWSTPFGYLLSSEAAAASGGIWTLSVGISQVLK